MFTWDGTISTEALAVAFSVAVPVIIFSAKKIYNTVHRWRGFIKAIDSVVKEFREVKALIEKELKTNGGTSLKDSINELKVTVSAMDGKFRAYASYANIIGWESDTEGRTIWVSPAVCELSGRSEKDFLGHSWRALVQGKDRDKVFREWDAAIREKRAFIMEFEILHRDGHTIPIMAETYVIRSGETVRGYVGIVRIKVGSGPASSASHDTLNVR